MGKSKRDSTYIWSIYVAMDMYACVCVADSFCYTVEANTTKATILQQKLIF